MACDGCANCVCDELRLEIAKLREQLEEQKRMATKPLFAPTRPSGRLPNTPYP